MKLFFSATYYFWLITKIIFLIAGAISVFGIFKTGGLRSLELLVNVIVIIYMLLMMVNIFLEFAGGQQIAWIRYFVGVISVLIGLALFILTFTTNVISIPLTIIFSLWIILLGVFDLLLMEKTISEE